MCDPGKTVNKADMSDGDAPSCGGFEAPAQWRRYRIMKNKGFYALICLLLCSCSHHPVDCALDFVPHDDCLPGTAGYESAQKRNELAATTVQIREGNDDASCKSFGLKFGTDEYAECREKLLAIRAGSK